MYFGAQKINILIVDDNPKNLLALEAILQSADRNLVRASSGEEALRFLLDNEVAVILLDVYMPGLDGLETAALIRGRHKSRNIPIIFLTADSSGASHLLRGYSLGAVDYILKPVEPEILKSKVAVFVELYKKTSQVKLQAELLREKNLELENENLQRLSQLVELGQRLAAERNPRLLLETFCHAARQIVGARHTLVGMLAAPNTNDTPDASNIKAARSEYLIASPDAELSGDAGAELSVPAGEMLAQMLEGKQPLRFDRKKIAAAHLDLPDERQPKRSLLGAPIFTPQQTYGWLLLIDKLDREDESELIDFNEADERLAVTLAAQIAVTYENAKLYTEAQTLTAELKQEVIERKQIEEERAELLLSEQAARLEAETANKTKDDFLAVLSHELRTPLTAILGWTQLMHNGSLDEEAKARALETIRRNARSQSQLIDDLLDVSRIITGKLRLETRPVAIKTVVEAALESIRPAAQAADINLSMNLEDVCESVDGDANRLQQVVWNLLSNAVKFTPRNGMVEVNLKKENDAAIIKIRDTGPGIPAEYLPLIFDRFRQVDGTTTRKHGGLGLGLAIVNHLVGLHGGTVAAESAGEGHGSIFTVRLPLQVKQNAPRSEADVFGMAEPNGLHNDSLLQNLRVLVVDDESDTREFIATVLNNCGAEVRSAASAAEAFEAVRQWLPNVMVSDIGLPGEDGYALLGRLRRDLNEGEQLLPSLALTAYASVEDRKRALAAGFNMHLAKPIEPNELVAVVASLAGRNGH